MYLNSPGFPSLQPKRMTMQTKTRPVLKFDLKQLPHPDRPATIEGEELEGRSIETQTPQHMRTPLDDNDVDFVQSAQNHVESNSQFYENLSPTFGQEAGSDNTGTEYRSRGSPDQQYPKLQRPESY